MSATEFQPPFLTASRLREEFGFSIIPLKPRGKQPADGFKWKPYQTVPVADEEIEAWNEIYPDANWGIVCGRVSNVVVVDIDGPGGKEWAVAHFPPTPFAVATGRGEHWYYRYPSGDAAWLRSFKPRAYGAEIDVQADGHYVVAPGSVHPSGAVYTLVPAGPLEEMPEFRLAAPAGGEIRRASLPAVDLGAVTADYTTVREGGRHNALVSYVGGLIAQGFAYKDALSAARTRNAQLFSPPLPDGEVQHVVSSLLQTHFGNRTAASLPLSLSTYTPKPVVTRPQDGKDAMEGLRYVTKSEEEEVPWPEKVLHPGGLLEKLADYIEASAVRTERIFAIAGAITILAALAGQRVRTESGLVTNFYNVVVGASASGKDAPKRAVINLLDAVHPGLYAGSDLSSDAAIVSRLASPTGHRACFVFDEIGLLLQSFKQPKGFRQNVVKLFTELSSNYRNRYVKIYADTERNQTIPWQSLSFLGLSVPGEFFKAFRDGETTNGWLARILVFEERRPPRPKRYGPVAEPSEALMDALREIWAIDAGDRVYEEKAGGGKSLRAETPANPHVLSSSEGAAQLHQAFDRVADQKAFKASEEGDETTAALWGRAAEHALKLAAIHALSEHGPAAVTLGVDVPDVDWAWTFVNAHHGRLVPRVRNAVAASETSAVKQRVREAILRYVRKEGQKAKSGHKPKLGAPFSHIAKVLSDVPLKLLKEAVDAMLLSKDLAPHVHNEGSPKEMTLLCVVEEDPDSADSTNSTNSTNSTDSTNSSCADGKAGRGEENTGTLSTATVPSEASRIPASMADSTNSTDSTAQTPGENHV